MLLKTNEFKSIFGNDYYVAVLVKNKDIFSKRSLTRIRELSNELKDSLSYADKVTSLTDLEFASGTEEDMTIEQIAPEQIPSDAAGLKEIKQKAYSKLYLAKKMVSTDGTNDMDHGKVASLPCRQCVEEDERHGSRHD